MSNDVIEVEAGEADDTVNEQAQSKGAGKWWLLVILLLVVLGAVSVFMYLQMQKALATSSTLGGNLESVDQEIQRLGGSLSSLQRENQELKSELEDLGRLYAVTQEDIQALFRSGDRQDNDWTMAEIEHLLVVATHRLALEKNPALALAAMQAADDRLRQNQGPGVLAIRQQLASDMNALRAVPEVDIAGLSLYLSDLVTRVANLPLQEIRIESTAEQQAGAAEAGPAKKLLASIWQELKSLVQISRQGDQTPATLLPKQRYFLYQNLRLQLEAARYAVMRRDSRNFHVSVEIVQQWLRDYFDTSNSEVDGILEILQQMTGLELDPELPDISSSLETVRAYYHAADARAPAIGDDMPAGEQE